MVAASCSMTTEAHFARRRPQMLRHIPGILDAISSPDVREEDPAPGRERFYRRDLTHGDG